MKRKVWLKSLLVSLIFSNVSLIAQNNINTNKIDSLLNYFFKNNKMMGSVAIAKDNKIIFTRAYGYSEIKNDFKIPADQHTKYRIGSISKMFTAVMIFQLIEAHKLSLNMPLSTFFPDLPNADKITVEDLLNHHSGLHNFTDDSSYLTYYTKPKTEKEMLAIFEQAKPDFQPDEKAEYSNTNFVLLGYIIEKITNDAYPNELRKRILNKINLKNTFAGYKINVKDDEALSYSFKDSAWALEPETDMSIPGGAGSIVSTPDDLIKFIDALFQGKLISKESLKEMTTLKDNFGMGIFRIPFYGRFAYGHTGGIDGFVSFISYFPDDSVALAFTSNGMNYTMNDILIGILSLYYEKPYAFPSLKTYKMSVQELSKFEGTYSSAALPLLITIKLKNDVLTAQATGQSSFELTAASENEFKFDPAGIVITFIKSKSGKFDEFNLKQGGGTFLYVRKK